MSADLPSSSQASSSHEAGASSPDQARDGLSSPSPAHLLDGLERLSDGDDRLLGHVTLPGRKGRIADWPQWVSPAVVGAWARRGVERPWIHQREAMDAIRQGRDVVLATGTGSGKSLAAWTPILSDLVEAEDSSRISAIHRRPTALYLAPTKALAADQLASLMSLLGQDSKPTDPEASAGPEGSPGLVDERLRRVRATTVDGDTPREAKEWARAGADLILSNPDFLHYVMLPSHQRWSRFLASLRLIVIDEEHEGAYKSETAPRYDAREVAKVRADMSGAVLVLGSATPSVESFYRAEQGEYRLLTLTKRAKENSRLAGVHIVDLREELAEGNRSIFSRKLKELIEDRLAKKQQVMLFMNRRGYAGFVSCRSCGKAIKCPHCDVSLTYHRNGRLKCHYCGFERRLPDQCPSCGSPFIAPFGTGTQKLEEFTKREFPEARILRMDADTTAKKGAHEEILATFAEGGADILIGTQMIVKGHDFANVTLMGVMAADLSLYAPDFKSAERTFELLTQASGRAGRGDLQGDVVIQTYAPDHYAVSSAAEQDYLQFYRQELLYRKMMGYPPLVGLLTIGLSSKREADVIRASEDLKRVILREYALDGLKVIGPVEDSPYKLDDNYRKILYMKHESYDILLEVRNSAQKRENVPDLFRNVFVQYDLT